MLDPSPTSLARAQVARDRKQLAKFPKLLPHKIDRMSASSFAFLRGAAPLFYELLRTHRGLLPGLPGAGWIAGDLHLENFGAFRPDGFGVNHEQARVVYGANDFDDAIVGPWELDALRLTTSLLLASRAWADGPGSLVLADRLLDAHAAGVDGAGAPPLPSIVLQLLDRVRGRKRVELLDHCTEKVAGQRRLRRGAHFHELPKPIVAAARKAFAAYVATLPAEERVDPAPFEIVDLAFRVSGTGSLGMLRIGFLVAGKGGVDGGWMFDMKEQGSPSPAILLGTPKLPPAERVLAAERACLEHPPKLAGTTRLGTRSMFVRRLAPQEDRVDLAAASPAELEDLIVHLGALAGAAHRRGASDPMLRSLTSARQPAKPASSKRAKPWTRAQRAKLIDSAIALAGLHEATYLSFLKETGRVS